MDHGPTTTTPLTATSQFIEAGNCGLDPMSKTNTFSKDNDEDFDEDNMPGFSHPSLAAQSPLPDKGKGRAPPEQLAPPSGRGVDRRVRMSRGTLGVPTQTEMWEAQAQGGQLPACKLRQGTRGYTFGLKMA